MGGYRGISRTPKLGQPAPLVAIWPGVFIHPFISSPQYEYHR